ncbi:SUKH-3 domain-containing protein [Actinoplanes sp. NPDC026619]|uniref:SUKH-3 domain-containing protein n=1 Tax=Actinoplanes sp. NPDC026619 TaxID=3155798 RepID=UPI0033FE47DD
MISRADADAVAASWARAESLLRGSELQALVEEFDLGFIVTIGAAEPQFSPSDLGTGRRVIDRATGRVSTWPNWPAETLQQVYRDKRPEVVDPPKTADPEVQLRREARRKVTPSVAAHATVDGRVYIARGAKGDQKLNHHRLVLERLAEQTPPEAVRGCERHAELIVCSDVLHDMDRRRAEAKRPALTLDEARQLLRTSIFETFQIREPGDPLAGQPNDPCESCTYALTQLALMPWSTTGALYPNTAPMQPNPAPGRFTDVVASELLGGSWLPDVPHDMYVAMAEFEMSNVIEVPGLEHQHEAFPAAVDALAQTGSVVIHRRAPGAEQRTRLVYLAPEWAKHSADVLHDFAQVLGARLFPIGSVNNESILAVDDRGRIFDLDQAGEWFIADTYAEALETLILGKRTHRVHDDGTWGPSED